MKKAPRKKTPEEKAAEKLAKLLGLTEVLEETVQQKEILQGNLHGVSEDKIKERRDLQGILYFLRAPDLFTFRDCNHCGTNFAVSRLQVAYCSYNCIRDSLKAKGLDWKRSENMEVIVRESYDGNEPLWISAETLLSLEEALRTLLDKKPFEVGEPPTKSPTPGDSELDSVKETKPSAVDSTTEQVVTSESTSTSSTSLQSEVVKTSSSTSFTSRRSTTSTGKRRITFS